MIGDPFTINGSTFTITAALITITASRDVPNYALSAAIHYQKFVMHDHTPRQ